ncbi:MAG: hypothetical protein PF440_08820 [Thiomicrorhabdus sp.]|jgi:hypothetical protein|nr:hypothetical protein [Thiomicrorhabdus sp.]
MALNSTRVVGNGSAQTVITNATNIETVVTLIVTDNTTVSAANASFMIGGQEVANLVTAAQTIENVDIRLNIPASEVFSVYMPVGYDVTIASYSQPVDLAAALTVTQQAVVNANAAADRAENALPVGAIDDTTTTAVDRAWSAPKLVEYTEKRWNYTAVQRTADYLASDREIVLCDNNITAQIEWIESITAVNAAVYTTTINAVAFSYTADATATAAEITAGIAAAVNAGTEPVTAVDNATYVALTADVAGVPFTVSINANMVVNNKVANSSVFQVTLPASPAEGDSVIIKDIATSFALNNMFIVANGSTIMTVADDMNLDLNDTEYKFTFLNNDWRV